MKYYYIRRQSGGCDYTIGCGVSVEEIRAKLKEVQTFQADFKKKAAEDEEKLQYEKLKKKFEKK